MVSVYDTQPNPGDLNTSHGITLDFVGWNKSILEIGCSTGFMTKVFQQRGCKVVGIEFDPDAASVATSYAEEVIVGDLEKTDVWTKVGDQKFDFIVAGDVLEHLKDPLACLRSAVSHINSTGTVVISLPNISHADVRLSLFNGRFDYRETGLLDQTHLHFFTIDTVRKLLREAGLVPVEIRRVVVPVFQTEIPIERTDVPQEILAEILRDPESESYQFVVRAVKDNGTQSIRLMAEQIGRLENELYAANFNSAMLGEELSRALPDALELRRVKETISFRLLAPPKVVWRKIRIMLGLSE